MVKTFSELREKYFSAGGDSKDLGVSSEYLALVNEEIIPPSRNLLLKLRKRYNVSLNDLFFDGLVVDSVSSTLLRTAEALSHNEKFVTELKNLSGGKKIKADNLLDLVVENYAGIQVRGRMSSILTNVAHYFVIDSSNTGRGVRSESEFNLFADTKNPFVALSESVDPYKFIEEIDRGGHFEYVVSAEFLPPNVKKISTNSKAWRKRFVEGVPRSINFEDQANNLSNKVFVEYKKELAPAVLDLLRKDVQQSYNNPDLFGVFKKGGKVLFTEHAVYSKLDNNGLNLTVASCPAMSLEDDKTVSFHFYPVQLLSHTMSSGGGDNYWPLPGTLFLANRFQNRLENRVNRILKQ